MSVSALGALIILNRFVFTEIGVHSFGRIWQYFVSYDQIGFAPRSFLGTACDTVGANRWLLSSYHCAYLLQSIFVVILSVVMFVFARKFDATTTGTLILFFSPATLLQAGYCTGSTHVHQMILLVLMLTYSRSPVFLGAAALIGVLTHEAFLLLAFAAALVEMALTREHDSRHKRLVALALLPAILVAAWLVLFRPIIDEREYVEQMAARIPDAVGMNHYWSGFFEISAGAQQNLSVGTSHLFAPNLWLYLSVPLGYFWLLLAGIIRSTHGTARLQAISASLLPLSFFPLGTDVYRWIGMACFVAVLTLLRLHGSCVREGDLGTEGLLGKVIAACCVLGPFGIGIINDPLPIYRFIIERL